MYFTLFSVFLLIVSPTIQAQSSQSSEVEEIYRFIVDHTERENKTKVSPRTPFPKFEGAKVTRTAKNLLQLDYEGFTIWLDCEKRGAIKFRYNAQRDTGRLKRYKKYHLDPNVPKTCQQRSFWSYGKGYDRGHLVPANHLDHSRKAITQSNYMTNILPQASAMNQGAWLRTEEITECYRDIEELLIIGGVIWGSKPDDDYFTKTHGVKTPDAYWKVIIRGSGENERVIAWVVPNSQEAKKNRLDRYLVSIADLERMTGEKIPVIDYAKHKKLKRSWMIPRGCNKG